MKNLSATLKAKTIINLLVLCAAVVSALPFNAQAANNNIPPDVMAAIEANYPDGLPRYVTPEELQWLAQQEALGLIVEVAATPTAPPAGATWSPGEYEQLEGILVRWTTGTSYAVLPIMVAEASENTHVWCFVENATEQTAANSAFTSAGANMGNVSFITYDSDSIWIRDYGPRSIYANTGHAMMDHTYNRPRAKDDVLPEFLATYWSDPRYDIGLTHGGGNFHAFSNGDGFSSTLLIDENPGYTDVQIKKLFRDYFNVNLTIYPRLTLNVDATGHIDMWFMPLGNNKVLISQFATNHPISKAITDAAAADMTSRGYTVYRTPAYNSTGEGSSGGTHFTYTNSVFTNNKIIIPRYGGSNATNDATALAVFQNALPGYDIAQVDCSAIIPLAGAVHCIMKHVYPSTTPVPIIEVTSANGGEWWLPSSQHNITWTAGDDVSVTAVDLYYSTNNGSNWNTITTGLSNTGSYNWTVPSADSTQCLIRAVARDAAANSRQDLSDSTFTISYNAPPAPASLPVLSGTVTTNSSSSARTSATFSHTVPSGDNRLLVVSVMMRGNGMVGSITYAGNNLIKGNTSGIPSTGVSGCRVENWYLVAPPVGSTNVVVTFAASVDPSYIAVSNFTNVNQSNPLGQGGGLNKTSGTSVTTSVTTLNDYSLIFGAVATLGGDTDPFTPGSGITERWDGATGTSTTADIGVWGGQRPATTAGAYTLNTTATASDDSAIAALEIRAAPVVTVSPPGQASNPTPSTGATNVSRTQDLSWTAGSGAASRDVYFGTVNPPVTKVIDNGTALTYDTGTMAANATYYWRVDEINAGGTTQGTVWSFTTNTLAPNVVGQTQAAATTAITGAGLVVGTVSQQYSNTITAGLVISQNPAGGTVVNTGSAVNIVVSLGKPVVPNVVGMTEAAATAQITSIDSLTVNASTAYSDTVAAGLVISQNPAGGTSVDTGSVVNIVISLGLPLIPDVTGQSQASAEAAIVAATFIVGNVTTAYSDTVPAGDVISQSIVGPATSGTSVDLVVSLGLPIIPDVTGQSQAIAEAAIVAATFTVGNVTTAHSDTIAAGDVISQSIVGPATSGTSVDLVVSLGLPIIPDVTNTDQASAEAQIIGAGFAIGTVTTAYSDTVAAGNVISQSIVGPATSGTSVDLVVSLGLPIIPDVTNIEQSVAEAQIIGAGFTIGTVTTAHSDTVAAGNVISQSIVGPAISGTAVDLVVSLGLPIIPDVTGQSQAIAEAAIVAATFTVGNVTTAYSDTVAAGDVISQSIVGPAASGTAVDLVVSLGLPIIPDVTGQSQAIAEAAIVAATFTVGNVTTAYSDTVAAGDVISQSIVGPATSGTAVDLVVSLGLPIIPDVTNTNQASAEAAIVAATFTVGNVTTAYSDTVAAGNVISQSIVGPATSGTSVDLVVSLGLPIIPDVTNIEQSVAEAQIIGAGFTIGTVTTAHSDTVAAGNVISQSIVGPATSGTAVDLVISLGAAPRTISGFVTEIDANIPIEGVFIEADNGGGSDTTDVNGYYELEVVYGWTGLVTLQKTGYTFEPAGTEYENITGNQADNYVAILDTFIISGYAVDAVTLSPLADVLVSPEDGGGVYTSKYYGGGSATTDVNGYYEVEVDYNWSGNVTASKYAYVFQPASIIYVDVIEDIAETQDFAGSLLTYKISGYIKNACQTPIASVTVQATTGASSAITDEYGYYEIWVDYNWSGTVTPGNKAHYTFNPISKEYIAVLENQTDQNYAADNIFDLDCDGAIGYGDIAVMGENWLMTGTDIPGDINRNSSVDFLDFTDFAEVWQD